MRAWLAWGALVVLVLLVLGSARRDRAESPADAEVTPPSEATAAASVVAGGGTPIATPTAPSVQPADRPEAGASRGSLEIDGRTREWRLYVPRSLAQIGEVPLVIGLHGGLGSGEQFAADGYFDSQAERGGFIAVYPDGITRRLIDARTWNAGGCCGTAMNEGVDDVGFIAALVERLALQLPIDRDRVYATGHSNGAMMAQRLACDRADLFAAIAVYSGPLQTTSCAPSEPISVLNIHGDADQNILIGGGNGPRAVTNTDYVSLADTAAAWVAFNGCRTQLPVSVTGAVTTSIWTDCSDGVVVQTQVVAGASHAWPGGAPTGPLRADPSPDLDASSAIWDFLQDKVR